MPAAGKGGDTADQIRAKLLARCKVFADGLEPVVQDVVDELAREVRRQSGLTDHTIKELAKLGHPYKRWAGATMPAELRRGRRTWESLRNFRKGIPKTYRIEREKSLGHDIKQVHVQSKTLYDAIYSYVRRTPTSLFGAVGIDPHRVPYLPYVVKGTRYMIPRDFIGRSAVIARSRTRRIIREGINALARQMGMAT